MVAMQHRDQGLRQIQVDDTTRTSPSLEIQMSTDISSANGYIRFRINTCYNLRIRVNAFDNIVMFARVPTVCFCCVQACLLVALSRASDPDLGTYDLGNDVFKP